MSESPLPPIQFVASDGVASTLERGEWMPIAHTFKINDLVLSIRVDARGGLWLKIHPPEKKVAPGT